MQQASQIDFSKIAPQEVIRLIGAVDQSFKAVEEDQPENTLLWVPSSTSSAAWRSTSGDKGWHPMQTSDGWTRVVCGFLYIRLISNGEMKLEIRSRNEKFDHPEKWIVHFSKSVADPNFFPDLNEFLKRYFIDE